MAQGENGAPSPPDPRAKLHAQAFGKKHNEDFTDMFICASAGSGTYKLNDPNKKRRKRKQPGVWEVIRTSIVNHQIGYSLIALALLTLTHLLIPDARPHTRKFLTLQYPSLSDNSTYHRGPDDIFYCLTWIILFTGLREAAMTYFLSPLASLAGIQKPKTRTRFAEQAWLVLYYALFWCLGVYIYVTSEYYLDMPKLWADFPVLEMSTLFKQYYLIQFAFWMQQIVVVNIEERRKDHWQMFTHHIVTCLLLLSSYGYYETRVGNVILCLMDVVDVVFPTAKLLKYAGWQTACDVAFGVFILSWFIARHVLYLTVCWSVYVDSPRVMTPGCYSSTTGQLTSSLPPTNDRFRETPGKDGTIPNGGTEIWTNVIQPYAYPGETVCYNERMQSLFLALLLFLQGITIMWFGMILRVAWRVLKGQGADDSRSDDEGEDENEEGTEDTDFELDLEDVSLQRPLKPLEEVVGVEGLNIKRKTSPLSSRLTGVKKEGQGSSSGIGVKKEILNRIGCDKPME